MLGLAAATTAVVLAWALSIANAEQVRCVVRPEISVQGVVTGSTVRLNGVVVGQVVRIGLWSDPDTGRVRPELVLSLDGAREPLFLNLPAQIQDGLRAEFTPVNPASGFLEVNLFWSKDPLKRLATTDVDEVPWQPSTQQEGIARVIPVVQRLAAADFRRHVETLVNQLESIEDRLADGPGVTQSLAERAATLRATAAQIETAAGPEAMASLQVRLADLREGLRIADATLVALERDLQAWPGPVGESLRAFSQTCRASAARLRREVPEDDAR